MSDCGTVYWITGLAGAGKTTIGKLLYQKLREQKPNVFLLDGDTSRLAMNDTDYTLEGRRRGAFHDAKIVKMISDQGIDVISCAISMFHDVRAWNRANMPRYREIFLDVPLDVLHQRDQKGLYSGFSRGEIKDVVGLDLPAEFPRQPELKIVNDGHLTPEEVLAMIMAKVVD